MGTRRRVAPHPRPGVAHRDRLDHRHGRERADRHRGVPLVRHAGDHPLPVGAGAREQRGEPARSTTSSSRWARSARCPSSPTRQRHAAVGRRCGSIFWVNLWVKGLVSVLSMPLIYVTPASSPPSESIAQPLTFSTMPSAVRSPVGTGVMVRWVTPASRVGRDAVPHVALGPAEGRGLEQRVGHQRGRLVLVAVEVEVLDLRRPPARSRSGTRGRCRSCGPWRPCRPT